MTVRLYGAGVESHAKAAAKFGATKEEVFEAITCALMAAARPAFSTGVEALYHNDSK